MSFPLVSIIVPCYNQGKYLGEALDSVLAQTYQDWECVIINDGSRDNTEEVAQEYCQRDCRFTYLYQENQGVVAARNNAIRSSHGQYILPLDGDDKIAPTYIEKAVAVIEQNPEVSIVYCDAVRFGAREGLCLLSEFSVERMLIENCIFCTALYRRSDYDKTIGYNPNMNQGLEDWDFWLSILEQGGTAYKIPEVLFYYRINNTSRNRSLDNIRIKLIDTIVSNHPQLYFKCYSEIHGRYSSLMKLPFFSLIMRIKSIKNKYIDHQ